MRIFLFNQYFLGANDSGGSRWNQFTNFFTDKKDNCIEVFAGNIHYATGKQIGKNVLNNKEKITEKILVHRTWTYSGYNSSFIGRAIAYFSYTFSAFIKAFLIKKADLIIVTSPPLFIGFAALWLKLLRGIPFIFEVRDLWPESAIATGVLSNKFLLNTMYWIEKKLYRNAFKIVVLTPAFKENIENRFPEYKEKIEIITNGADLELIPEKANIDIRKKYNWEDKFIFSYFGAHGVANDLIQIINVARDFKDNFKNTFCFGR